MATTHCPSDALAVNVFVEMTPPYCGYYALPERRAGGFGPDVLTLQSSGRDERGGGVATLPQTKPRTQHFASRDADFYRQKQNRIAVRHVSGDHVVALIEIVSPGNKDSATHFKQFVEKAGEFLDRGINMMLIDPFPAGRHDPRGVHAAVWEAVAGESFALPPEQPLTIVSYDASGCLDAYIETLTVGDPLPGMPLYLEADSYITVPLNETYHGAWETVPKRWRDVIDPSPAC